MSQPACSIVIRAYNEERHIGRLLTGILEQTVSDVQIILVDSGSTDATVSIASRFPVEVVHIQPAEFTFGRSLNFGITHAASDKVVIASAHVYPVYADWLEKLLAPFANPKIAVSYGPHLGADSSKFSEHMVFRSWFPEQSIEWQDNPFCNNANAAIRTELWREHPYDESLTGLEDLEWARWAQSKGFGVSFVAEAPIVHVHHESWAGVKNRYRREAMAFKRIYPEAGFPLSNVFKLLVQNVRTDWAAARKAGVYSQEWFNIVRFRWQQFWGTFQGYQDSKPLTPQLKETFYYPSESRAVHRPLRTDVAPINYQETEQKAEAKHES